MDLISASQQLLDDVILFLSKLDNGTYNQPIPELFNSTLGKHTRHIIEVYQCLLFRKDPLFVNYDGRERSIEIETNLAEAEALIKQIKAQLSAIKLAGNIFVMSMLAPKHKIASSISRELLYNHDHCLHHLAIMKVGLVILRPEIELPSQFGVAPSTLKYSGNV